LTAPAPLAERPVRRAAGPDGLLLLDKPAGPTSHDAVLRVRRRFADRGAGHLGTLDPAASGLLVVALGAATRCIPVWQGGAKTYEATLRLGVVTASQDLDGAVLETHPVTVNAADLRRECAGLVGDIEQVPPMVSALKHGGERLHAIARRGETVERAPRRVRIETWDWLGFELPEATFRVRCSGGTYVRTLAHDLGRRLGCGAALARLRRLRSEPFDVERAVTLDELDRLGPEQAWAHAGVPLDRALDVLPEVTLDAAAEEALGHGRPVEAPRGALAPAALGGGPRSVVLRDAAGRALALGEAREAGGGRIEVHPRVVLPWAVREGPR
jgi:tRNA pseudouridine55 synthase